jgi:hypothetical protein
MLAELGHEAVARPLGWCSPDGVRECRMLRDQLNRPRPRRQRVDRPNEAGPEQGAGAVAAALTELQAVDALYKLDYFGRVEDRRNVGVTRYLWGCQRNAPSVGRAPGSCSFAGALFCGFAGKTLQMASDGTCPSGGYMCSFRPTARLYKRAAKTAVSCIRWRTGLEPASSGLPIRGSTGIELPPPWWYPRAGGRGLTNQVAPVPLVARVRREPLRPGSGHGLSQESPFRRAQGTRSGPSPRAALRPSRTCG